MPCNLLIFYNELLGKKVTEFLTLAIEFIEREITVTNELISYERNFQNCPLKKEIKPLAKIRWTSKVVNLEEVLIALHAAKCINDGDITKKEMFSIFGAFFNVNLNNYSQSITEMTQRKRAKDRTQFFDILKKKFIEYLTELDERSEKR